LEPVPSCKRGVNDLPRPPTFSGRNYVLPTAGVDERKLEKTPANIQTFKKIHEMIFAPKDSLKIIQKKAFQTCKLPNFNQQK